MKSNPPCRAFQNSLNPEYPPDYPQELLWKGRNPDQSFQVDELLYFRTPAFNESGHVDGNWIPFPDTSVNRGKYSSPRSVLFARYPKFLNQKVAEFAVGDIPKSVTTGDGRIFDIRIEHDPVKPPQELFENYSHCEIRCFQNNTRSTRVSDAAKKFVREVLGAKMKPAPEP